MNITAEQAAWILECREARRVLWNRGGKFLAGRHLGYTRWGVCEFGLSVEFTVDTSAPSCSCGRVKCEHLLSVLFGSEETFAEWPRRSLHRKGRKRSRNDTRR